MSIVAGSDILASDFVSTSAGAGDSGRVPKLAASDGKLDRSFIRGSWGGTGADGALSVSSGITTINLGAVNITVKNYTSVSITGTGSFAFSNPHANGSSVWWKIQGNSTNTSSATRTIDMRNMGTAGGAGADAFCGAGGFGAGAMFQEIGGAINFTGAMDFSGTNGTNAPGGAAAGGGGGGGGGHFMAIGTSITANTSVITVTGGSSGAPQGGGINTTIGTKGGDVIGITGLLAGGAPGAGTTSENVNCPNGYYNAFSLDARQLCLFPGSGGGGGSRQGQAQGSTGQGMGGGVTGLAIVALNIYFA